MPSTVTGMASATARPPPEWWCVADGLEVDEAVSLSAGTVRPETVVDAEDSAEEDKPVEVMLPELLLPLLLELPETMLMLLLLSDSGKEVTCDGLPDRVADDDADADASEGGRPDAYVKKYDPVVTVVVVVAPTVMVVRPPMAPTPVSLLLLLSLLTVPTVMVPDWPLNVDGLP